MIGPIAYNVLTEFRFDVAGALLSSKQLQGAVSNISGAADDALISFQKLGAGIVAQFGLGTGSALGVIGKAVQVADKFQQSQLGFANIISSNMDALQGPINSFNDRLAVSEDFMNRIGKAARDFALDETDMLSTAKLLTAQLVPKGLAGNNFSNALDMSRGLLKSAPTLGVDPGLTQGELVRAIEGHASMGDTLFRRLSSETAPLKGISTSRFNTMKPEERVDRLRRALLQFGSDTDVLKGNVMTLAGQFRELGNLVSGPISSILRPLGKVVLKPLVELLHEFNQMLDRDGRGIIKSLSQFVGPFLENPKKFIVGLLQARELTRDLGRGAHVFEFVGIAGIIQHFFGSVVFRLIGSALMSGVGLLRTLIVGALSLVGITSVFKLFTVGFSIFSFLLTKIVGPMALISMFMQIISRARAIANVNDALALPAIMATLTDWMARLSVAFQNIFLPITMMMNLFASLLAPLFQVTTAFNFVKTPIETFISLIEWLGKAMVTSVAFLSASFAGLFRTIENFQSGRFGDLGNGVVHAFDEEFNRFMAENMKKIQSGDGIVNQVTNIGKVEIRNDFKENLQPDRIAFTIKEQLLKSARNPTQGRNRSLQTVPVGGN
jgi:hypothetical protein